MIKVTYTATRELCGTHASGDVVTLEFSAQEPLITGREVSRDVQKALNGSRETLHHYGLRTWRVTSEPLAAETMEEMVQFLASVEGGEAFTFEPWRYTSELSLDLDFTLPRFRVVDSPSCALTSEGWTLDLLMSESTGGSDDWYTVSFEVIELP